jgi:hypothetical protein
LSTGKNLRRAERTSGFFEENRANPLIRSDRNPAHAPPGRAGAFLLA